MPVVSLNVPIASSVVQLEASPGTPLFIVGRNGVGKSALVQKFFTQLGGKAIYLPGSRPSYFDQESLSLNPDTRKRVVGNLRNWDLSPDTRWKSLSGTSRNEKAIYDLTAAEMQFKLDAANEIARGGDYSKAVARLQAETSPLDRVNALLRQANLPVTVAIEGAELRAKRDGSTYSIAKMSDGERSALVLIAEVVAAPTNSSFLIDEPELHLHGAIVVPLIRSLIRENPESTFVVSTHELELLTGYRQLSIAIVRSCSWSGDSISSWEVDTIAKTSELPDDLRVDLVGSRQIILFVEGTSSSLDSPLYALLFPNASVRSRESCREVERVVSGLRGIEDTHHTKVFGIIDDDGMSAERVIALQAKAIYPLPVHAVESLYYSEEVLKAIAARQGETLGVDPHALLEEAKAKGLAALDINDRISHLASRIAERQLRDGLLQHLPSRTDLMSGNAASVSVVLPSPYPAELARLKCLRTQNDIAAIISRYPVRESGLLDAVAKGLRFLGRADYERAVLGRLSTDEALINAVRAKMGALASQLV